MQSIVSELFVFSSQRKRKSTQQRRTHHHRLQSFQHRRGFICPDTMNGARACRRVPTSTRVDAIRTSIMRAHGAGKRERFNQTIIRPTTAATNDQREATKVGGVATATVLQKCLGAVFIFAQSALYTHHSTQTHVQRIFTHIIYRASAKQILEPQASPSRASTINRFRPRCVFV